MGLRCKKMLPNYYFPSAPQKRCLYKTSGWCWSPDRGRPRQWCGNTRRQKGCERVRSRSGFCSVCWMRIFLRQSVFPLSFWSLQQCGQYVWIHLHVRRFALSRYFLRAVDVNYVWRLAQLLRGVAAYVMAAVELICVAAFVFCVRKLSSASAVISDFTLMNVTTFLKGLLWRAESFQMLQPHGETWGRKIVFRWKSLPCVCSASHCRSCCQSKDGGSLCSTLC